MPDQTQLVDAALRLRGEAPAAWDQFLVALQIYQAQQTADMLRADPALLMRAQGMALALHELFATLRSAPQIRDKALTRQQELRRDQGVKHHV